MRTPVPTAELAEAIRLNQENGWTWETVRDRGGPSTTKITQIVAQNGPLSLSTITKLETAYGWPTGLGLDLVSGDESVRRGALTRSVVGPPRQDASRERGSRRGEDLTVGERTEVVLALKSVGEQMLAMGGQMIALASRLAPDDDPD